MKLHHHVNTLLEIKLIDLAFRKINFSVVSALLLASLIVVALWPVIEHERLLAWLAAMTAIMVLHFFYLRRYMHMGQGANVEPGKWKMGFVIGGAAAGLCWGSTVFCFPSTPFDPLTLFGVFVFPSTPFDPVTVLVLFVLAGVTAYASVAMASVPSAAIVFLVCAWLPLAMWLFSFGEHMYFIMGLIALSYLGVMVMLSRQMYHTIRGLFSANERNKALQEQVSSVAMAVPGFLYTIRADADGHTSFPFASAGVEDVFGLRPEDIRADAAVLRARYHPDDLPCLLELMTESARTLALFNIEIRIAHPQKGERWIEIRSIPQRQSGGSTEWHGLMIDITERKRMEQVLAARERDFRSLADNLPDNIARLDAEGNYLYINPTHERTLGIAASELIGKPLPDTHEHVKAAVAQVVASGRAVELVRQTVPVNGELQIHEVTLVPEFDTAGQVVSVLGLGRDMTEFYRMQDIIVTREQEFRSLAESSPDVVIRVDRDLRIRYLNANMVKVLELGSAEKVIGRQSIEIWPDGRFNEIDALRERVVTSGEMESVELTVPVLGGKMVYHHVISIPERDTDGHIIGTITFGRDISAIRETERRLSGLVESLPGIAFALSLSPEGEMSFPYVSAGVEEIYGITPEAAMGDFSAMHGLIHPDDKPGMEALFAESMRTLTPFRVEMRICPHGLPERWIDVRSDPQAQPDGSILWYGLIFDITERKRAAVLLEESERRLVRYFASTPGYFQLTELRADGSFAVPFASDGIVDLFGIQPDDVMENVAALAALNHPDDAEMVFGKAAESARDLTPYQVEYRIFHPHKGLRWIECISSPERLADGGTRWYGFMHDITERKRMEQALAARERDFRCLAENMPDNIARWDTEGRFLYCNPTHLRTLGKPIEELIGKTHDELFPDGRFAPFRETLAQVVAARQVVRITHVPVPAPGGGIDIHDVNMVPEFDAEGRVVSVLGIGRDMTGIYRMQEAIAAREQEFRSLAESSPDFIIRYDLDHRILYLNAPLVRDMKLASADEVIGKRPIEFWPDGRFAVIDDAAKRAIASGTTESIELVWTQEPGVARIGQIVVVPERDVAGQIVGTIAFGRDITEFKRLETVSEAALAEAMQLAQMRSTFLSQMSHELRTPLNGILGFAQMLQMAGAMSEEQREWVNIIQQSGDHLLSLINDILDHAKLEAEKVELYPGDIRLDEFLGMVAGVVRVKAEQKRVAFLCEVAADFPGSIRADEKRLLQVLLNLLANAVKFTDHGQVILRVGSPAPGRVRFEVRDSGVGIAEGQLEAIFWPFEQVGEASFRGGGTGLGLAISRKLVRLMGGDIKVESRLGEGSIFSFDLDMETVQSEPTETDAFMALAEHTVPAVASPPLLAPQAPELEILHDLAQRGNMRSILRRAAYLAGLDERYGAFAGELEKMAKAYQSKAILDFVAQHLELEPES